MASKKNKWRRCGRLEFKRETKRYSDGTPWGHDVLYVRIRKCACVVIEPMDHASGQLSVLLGTYRIARPVRVANLAMEYLNEKSADLPADSS